MKKAFLLSILLILLITHCSSKRTRYKALAEEKFSNLLNEQEEVLLSGRQIERSYSSHFNLRKPQLIIIHQTVQQSCRKTLNVFANPYSQVSSHYVICKDGTIIQIVDDHLRAWHAGAGQWGNIIDMNSVSLGIELDNSGYEPFPKEQVKSLISLLQMLKQKYKIPSTNILGHGDVAPARKEGPHCLFPWDELAEYNVAIMPDSNLSQDVPERFDYLRALRLIGYNVSEPKETIQAFRRHYIGCDAADTELLNSEEMMILKNVASKY